MSDIIFYNDLELSNSDLKFDDGGSFTTTVQRVAATANRTITYPDATGNVALVNGANGTVQYNNNGALQGNIDFIIDLDWNDVATVFTGLKLNITDTASAAGSKSLDIQVNSSSIFKLLDTVPTHADNTAATGAGLTAGDVYRTATGSLQIVF